MIVVIEGNDAVGKAVQAKMLAERLKGTLITVPDYTTETGREIFGNLKQKWVATSSITAKEEASLSPMGDPYWKRRIADDKKRNAFVFQSLMILNRYEMLPRIETALALGPVVFDRWTQSATVYGTCAGLDPEWLERVQAALPVADVNILIDVPVEESFKRRPERRDRHETDRPFLEKVRLEYLKLWGWEGEPLAAAMSAPWDSLKANTRDWQVVNGLGTVEEIHDRIVWVIASATGKALPYIGAK